MENMLRTIRKQQNLTQMALARRIGSTPSWLTFVERYGHIPGPELRERIAAALEVAEADLWPGLHTGDSTDMPEAENDTSAA